MWLKSLKQTGFPKLLEKYVDPKNLSEEYLHFKKESV